MRKVLLGIVLTLVVCSVSPRAVAKESSLNPPAQSSPESRQADVQICITQARAELSSGKPLDDDAMPILQGNHTEGFIRDGRPSVSRDYIPTPSKSVFVGRSGLYGPAALSDRYVVCLLKRGYTWENSVDPSGSATPLDTPSVAMTNHPETAKITLGHYTQGIAFTPGAVWVAYSDEKMNANTGVFRVDPQTNQMVTVIQTGKSAAAVAAGEGAVWIANLGERSVTRIDPETNRIVATIPVGKYPFGLDVGEGSVWVTNAGSDTVSRIDAKQNAIVATIPVGKRPAGIAVGGGFVWVANSKSKSVSGIDPKTDKVVATIAVNGEPITLTAQGTDIWASAQSRSGFSVVRIDAKTNSVVAETKVTPKGQVGGTALLGGGLWVADRANGTLSQIDVQTNAVIGSPISVGDDATIVGLGTDGSGAIWLSNSSAGTVSKVKP